MDALTYSLEIRESPFIGAAGSNPWFYLSNTDFGLPMGGPERIEVGGVWLKYIQFCIGEISECARTSLRAHQNGRAELCDIRQGLCVLRELVTTVVW